jgi:hypothetical protein
VKPEVPAQVPSVETLWAAVGLGLAVTAAVGLGVVVVFMVLEEGALLPQVPKPDWQPVPQ